MITLTKLNNQLFTINSDLIETVEQTPDTVVAMTTGNKYIVKETPAQIIERIVSFKRKIYLLDEKNLHREE